MNMPTVACGAVEKRRLVTATSPMTPPEATANSTPPAEFGARNAAAIMSLNAFDSRGASTTSICGACAGQVPRKHRYVAVRLIVDV